MDTLLADLTNWDLVLDTSGNIALASEPYSIAQDVASAVKTFLGEVYYDSSLGLPYFSQILGQRVSASFLKTQVEKAALTVPDVVTANFVMTGLSGRTLTGQIEVTDVNGDTTVVNLQ